jgi:hypothetical protein
MEKSEKIMLAGNLKASAKFGPSLIEGAINLDILQDARVKELVYEYEGKSYLNVKVVTRKSASEFGATHYIEIDQFVPEKPAKAKGKGKK